MAIFSTTVTRTRKHASISEICVCCLRCQTSHLSPSLGSRARDQGATSVPASRRHRGLRRNTRHMPKPPLFHCLRTSRVDNVRVCRKTLLGSEG